MPDSPTPTTDPSTLQRAADITADLARHTTSTHNFDLEITIRDTEVAAGFEHDLIQLIAFIVEHSNDVGHVGQCIEYRLRIDHQLNSTTDNRPF